MRARRKPLPLQPAKHRAATLRSKIAQLLVEDNGLGRLGAAFQIAHLATQLLEVEDNADEELLEIFHSVGTVP